MNITLRQRLKGKKIRLYLDYYDNGNRKNEFLSLFLFPEPEKGRLTKEQKKQNVENMSLAEAIRSKKHLEITNGEFGFHDLNKKKSSFITYFEYLTEKRRASQGNYGNWDSTLKHLKKFVKTDITFSEIDKKWVEDFKSYLINVKSSTGKPLSQNSKASYFNKIAAAFKEAYKEGIIQKNPVEQVDGIRPEETQKEFLTQEELITVAKTECDIPILKRAFLFSAITGLRWSDIEKLVWSEVQHSKDMGFYIRYRQKKTKGVETLPISEAAFNLLGERRELVEKVFEGLKYSAWYNLKLQQWVMKAGISKSITFHCARHTYATLQLLSGTDPMTITKMIGHRSPKHLQTYIKIVDRLKIDATNKIKLEM